MMDSQDFKFITSNELATRWRCSLESVTRWRREGKDPPFYKINGNILYKMADIEAMEQARKQSTTKSK